MKLLDEKEYEKNLKELMETPFGGKPQKPTVIQNESHSKVINDIPIETQTIPVSATPQTQIHVIKEQSQPVIVKESTVQPQSSPISLHKTGTAQLSLTRLGVLVAVGGGIFGYLYATNPSIKTAVTTGLTKLSTLTNNPIIMGSIVVGVFLCSIGLIFRN